MFYVADGHCDFLYGMVEYGYDLKAPKGAQTIRLSDMRKGNVALQFFAAWTETDSKIPPLDHCLMMIDAYQQMLSENPELTPFHSGFDPEKEGIGTLLTIEGGEAIDGSRAILRIMYDLGVRAMSFTWNENNELSGAALDRGNRGLTQLGKEIVSEMDDLGMAIDVSHLSDAAIDDILSLTDVPIFASHSNARSVTYSKRSISDAHIEAIAKRGGTVGVNFYHKQLTEKPKACIADIVKHITHICSVGGVDCCAIGSDLDGMNNYPVDFRTSADFPALADALLKSGFSEKDIKKIFYGNLSNYISRFV